MFVSADETGQTEVRWFEAETLLPRDIASIPHEDQFLLRKRREVKWRRSTPEYSDYNELGNW